MLVNKMLPEYPKLGVAEERSFIACFQYLQLLNFGESLKATQRPDRDCQRLAAQISKIRGATAGLGVVSVTSPEASTVAGADTSAVVSSRARLAERA